MGVWSTIGKGIAKGAKFVFEHRKEIGATAKTVKDTADIVSDLNEKRRAAKNEKEYYAVLEEENVQLKDTIQGIAQGIDSLGTLYDDKVQEIDTCINALSEEIHAVREELDRRMQHYDDALLQIRCAQEEYQKKADFKFMVMGVCGIVGIIVAVVLAVVL